MAYETVLPRLMGRMLRAARLEGGLYAEVKVNPTATVPAATVVILVVLVHAIGASLRAVILWGEEVASAFVVALITEITFWAAASFAIYLSGKYIFGGTATYDQVLRPFGFACVPGLLILIAALASLAGASAEIPVLALLILWRGVAGFVAARQALSLGMGQSAIALLTGVVSGVMVVRMATGILWDILSLFSTP